MSPAGREIAGLTRKPPSLVGKLQQVISFVLSWFCYSYWTFAQKNRAQFWSKYEKKDVFLTAIENHYQLRREQSPTPAIQQTAFDLSSATGRGLNGPSSALSSSVDPDALLPVPAAEPRLRR